MDINKDNDILALLNGYNLLPTRKDKRSLIQSYYSSINIDNSLCSTTTCSTRPLSHVELLVDKVYQLSEIYLTNQLEQAFIKAKLGKSKQCEYDTTMSLHYWVQHLTIFYQDIVSYSNTYGCINDNILSNFKDKYAIDCILENISCKKDTLALLFNKIYKVFLNAIPTCDGDITADWGDEFYCLCDAPELPAITINEIIPTYRTLTVNWNHSTTGLLYLVEVLNYKTGELVNSTVTSEFKTTIDGLVPDTGYIVKISASNCKSTVMTSQNQETLPVFITVNLIDNRDITNTQHYELSFTGTRQLEENEEFILDFTFFNTNQSDVDFLIPNKYAYFNKAIISNIEISETILLTNKDNSKLIKLDYYLGLLTQGRLKVQPLINTTIDLYLDEIVYEYTNGSCEELDLEYNGATIRNTEFSKSISLLDSTTALSITNAVNVAASQLYINTDNAQSLIDSRILSDSAVCCTDPDILDIGLNVTDNLGNSFTINYTPTEQSTITILITNKITGATIFTGDLSSNINSLIVDDKFGITGNSEYIINVTVKNCKGTKTEELEILTGTTYTLSLNVINDIGNVRVTTPRGGTTEITEVGTTEFILRPNEIATVDVGIVDLDTGNLDANSIDISYPNYKMPLRISSTQINGANSNGVLLNGITDNNGIVRARQHNINMTSNKTFNVTFTQINPLYDFDFENPNVMLDSVGSPVNLDSKVYSLNDRIGTLPSVPQANINLQGTRRLDSLELINADYLALYPNAYNTPGGELDGRKPTSYFVAKPTAIRGQGYFLIGSKLGSYSQYDAVEHGWASNFLYVNYRFLYNNFGQPAFNPGELNKPYLAILSPYWPTIRTQGNWYTKNSQEWYHPFSANTGIGFGSPNVDLNVYRLLGFDYTTVLTSDEITLLNNKMLTKYNVA